MDGLMLRYSCSRGGGSLRRVELEVEAVGLMDEDEEGGRRR